MGEYKTAVVILVVLLVLYINVIVTVFYLALISSITNKELLQEVFNSIWLSLVTSLVSTTIVIALTLPVSYFLSQKWFRGKHVISSLFAIPYILSPSATGLILLIFLVKNPVGKLLNDSFNFINDPKGIVLAQVFLSFPLALIYYTSLFRTIPASLLEVSRTLGFGRIEGLYKIFIPLLKPQVIAGAMLIFARAFGDFGASLVLGGGIRGRTVTLPIALFLVNQYGDLALLAYVLAGYVMLAFALLMFMNMLER
ncbi:MAG: ABC transporter permease subunit [Thermosphaera sp.]